MTRGAVAVLVALVLSACAGPGQELAQEVASPAKEGSFQCDAGQEHWRAKSTPKRGGTMVITLSEIDHLDVTSGGRSNIGPQVYNSLVEYRGCFPEDVGLAPSLAKSWDVSPDGTTWTFKLRDNVRWHDKPPVNGRAFNSADVAWTIEHQKNQGLLGSLWKPVAHREPDPGTVVLEMTAPDPDFLIKVGHHQNFMVPREVKEQQGDFKRTAIGTGAYMLKDFRPGQDYVLERNPNYYEMGDDGKPLPYLDQVRVIIFADSAAEVAALRSSQLDHTRSFAVTTREAVELRRTQPKLQ